MRHVAEREFGRFGALGDAGGRVARAVARAREARAAFIAALPEGTGPLDVTSGQLRGNPALAEAREAWRAAGREEMTARDDAEGLGCAFEAAGEDAA